jgi:hypothetical protein
MIVFLTLYLGLVSGRQPLALRADPAVKSIRIVVDGTTLATMTAPPWRVDLNFGPLLLPHEIVAVGFDADGIEVARVTQFANLPRRMAEMDVVLTRDAKGRPARAAIVARHVTHEKVRRASIKLDDKEVALDNELAAKIPAIDMMRPHVLTAEVRFSDGTAARREVVFGGQYAESTQAQLTPIVVTRTAAGDAPVDRCIVVNGAPLNVRSVERSTADVVIVRDPDARNAYVLARRGSPILGAQKAVAALEDGTFGQILSPIPEQIRGDAAATTIFTPTFSFDASKYGMYYALAWLYGPRGSAAQRQWADAVAVAGISAIADGRRRAVVLVLGDARDYSEHSPAVVRRYLDALGVPLFVWSVEGPRPDLAASWGDVDDVSSMDKLVAATNRIRRTLAEQRVVWVTADPLTALRAQVKDGCGYARIAR